MSQAAAASDALKRRMIEAMQLHVQGHLDAARGAYEALLADYPRQPDLLNALGTISLQTQQWEKAEEYFRQALAANPEQPRHVLSLARALAGAGKTELAMDALVKLLKIDRSHEEALTLLHTLCLPEAQAGGMKGSAIDRLIAANPNALGVRSVAVRLARTLDDHAERLHHLEALYRHDIRSDNLYNEYGRALKDNGQFDRALAIAEEGLGKHPDSLPLLRLRGDILLTLGQYERALEDGLTIVARTPDDHYAHTTIGSTRLLMSDGREGYEEYAAHRDYEMQLRGVAIPIPEWRGEPLAGRHLLVWSSQGVGDVIMFASLLPWVLGQGARVTLAIYPKLIPLFARSFPGIRLVPYVAEEMPNHSRDCDFHIILGQLMPHVLPHYTPAQHPPYLKADPARVQALSAQYRAFAAKRHAKKLVGISWHTVNTDTFSQRNIPLEQWRPLFEVSQVQYVSLQYGDHATEIEAINRRFPGVLAIDPDIDAFGDIDALAAQIQACDEVVSIQNSTIHLAGALGVKTTLLLSAASEWRWGLKRSDNRWYKSVTVERQEKLLDWQPVLHRVRERLAGGNPAMDGLVARLAMNPNDTEAQKALSALCLPDAKIRGIKGSAIDRLIAAHPKMTALRLVALMVCRALDERVERLVHLEALRAQGVEGKDFYWEYAAMLNYNGQYDRCMQACKEALLKYPDAFEFYRVRAAVHGVRGEYKAALKDYAEVLVLNPGDIQARMVTGMIKLLTSDGREGFEEYDAVRDRVLYQCKLTIPIPEWRGEPLAGKRLLLWCNEGVGDIVMFASLLPWLLGQGAQVTLAVYPKLVPLFARSFPNAVVIPFMLDHPKEAQQLFDAWQSKCDFQLAFSQLMQLGLAHYAPAEHSPYLKADAARTQALKAKYQALFPAKKLVGISWHSVNQDTSAQRNIPLMAWRALLQLSEVQYISLQYGDCPAEIDAVNRTLPGAVYVDRDIDAYGDTDALAAQIRAMDEVISIQNATVHLAGALGVKTTIMLSAASDWRWGLHRTDSRWYKTVLIERQETLMEWAPLMERVRHRLAIESLAERLVADSSDAEAVGKLHDLCLPEVKTHGIKGSVIDRLITTHPKSLGLLSAAVRLCRTVDDRKMRLHYLEALYRLGVREDAFYMEYTAMLAQNGEFERCLQLCDEGLKIHPEAVGLRRVRAMAYGSLGQHAKALAEWSWVIPKMPQDPVPRAAVGILKLLTSDCREGFEEFAALRDKMIKQFHLTLSLPEWRGEPIAGKRLLLWCNEGVGDIVMFASLLPWVLEQGARVTLVMYPKLVALFARSFPEIKIVPFHPQSLQSTLSSCEKECDVQLIMSQLMALALPHYTPAQHPPYLKADRQRVGALRKKYLALTSAKKLVGISWNTDHKDNAAQRNIALEQWQPLFALPHVQYVSLQYRAQNAEAFGPALHVDRSIEAFDDMDALAAQIAAMDEVISIQNSTVHLAGALGIKTTLMLSAASDWRWGLERTDSRWYKSVAIERQETLMDWQRVLMHVRDRLAKGT